MGISLKSILLLLLGFYLLIMLGMYLWQRQLLYFPQNSLHNELDHNYFLRREDITLRGWTVNPASDKAMVYFGGNADRIESHIDWLNRLFPDHALYLVNYRGYGGSDGSPDEAALTADAIALYDDIVARHESVSLIGRSLGSGVATHVAANREIHKLVLITPYDSIVKVARRHYPLVPVHYLMHDRWESWKNARNIDTSTLVVYGGMDRIVPRDSTERLLEHFDERIIETLLVDDADHMDIMHNETVLKTITGFVN